jgi:hypothetical protein
MQEYNIKDGLKARFVKVSENGSRTGVRIVFKSESKTFDSIKAEKVDLLGKATKLKRNLIGLDIDFNEDEIKNIIGIAKETLKSKIVHNDIETININDSINAIYHDAKRVHNEDTLYEDGEYIYINVLQLPNILKQFGWEPLKFKKQLRDMGVLDISKGRPFEFKKNSSRVKGTIPIWYLKIRINSQVTDVCNIEAIIAGVEVA